MDAKRDGNRVPTLLGTSNADGITPVVLWADPVTHRLLVDLSASSTYVVGPASATDNHIVVFDTTTGKLIKDSGHTLSEYELLSNKATTFGTINDTLYPTVKAVNDAITSAVVGLLDYRGSYNASTNLFPATGGSGIAGAVLKGDFWIVSAAGTLGGSAVYVGDMVIALQDTPAQTAANWNIIEYGLSYVPENAANKVTSISAGSTDTQYGSAKLLFDQLALKQASLSIASVADVNTGTDNAKYLTPLGLAGSVLFHAPEGTMYNGRILPTVDGSGNLTVALKTLAGTDPSASDPVYVMIGGVVRSITGALSKTVNAAANTFNAGSAELATKEIDYPTLLSYNATDGVVLAFSRYFGNIYSDFSATATNEKYVACSGTHMASTDPFVVIGRFAATLSAGAGYTWSVPTFTASNLIQRPPLISDERWINWTPTISQPNTPTTPTINAKYVMSGRKLFFEYNIKGTANGTAFGDTVTMSLPFTPVAFSGSSVRFLNGLGMWTDNASYTETALFSEISGNTIISVFPTATRKPTQIGIVGYYEI